MNRRCGYSVLSRSKMMARELGDTAVLHGGAESAEAVGDANGAVTVDELAATPREPVGVERARQKVCDSSSGAVDRVRRLDVAGVEHGAVRCEGAGRHALLGCQRDSDDRRTERAGFVEGDAAGEYGHGRAREFGRKTVRR